MPGPVRLPEGRTALAWVFPVSGEPIRGGFIEVSGGTIAAVGYDQTLAVASPVAVLPRPVNLHTHLELSACRQPIGAGDPLADWIPKVLRSRSGDAMESVRQGMAELARYGTAAALDIAQPGYPAADTADVPVIAAPELIGLDRGVAEERLNGILERSPSAISPHAPYSLDPCVRDRAVAHAASESLLVTTHLAESPAERQLLESGDGPLREMLQTLGVWQPGLFGGRTIAAELAAYGAACRLIVAHGNDLRPSEFERLARPGRAVAYCPRTHAFFGYGRHPVLEMQSAGVAVGLGTDSRASNPDLDVWNEVRFLIRHRPDIPPHVLVEMATRVGAEALGLNSRFGTLEPGRSASVLVHPLAKPDATDPYEALFG